MSLPNYLAKIKSSGIYRFVWDKSEVTATEAETLRLVVGYSEKGPFNTPVYIDNTGDFKTIFGDVNKKLEKRGVFFHRMALQALSAGPILALNLKKFVSKEEDSTDYEHVEYVHGTPNKSWDMTTDTTPVIKIDSAELKEIYDTARSIKSNAVIQYCPCGDCFSVYNLPYTNKTVSSDPESSYQIRTKGYVLRALAPKTAYYGDHIELSDNENDYPTQLGIGAVLGTKFTWPKDNPYVRHSYLLTPEKEELLKNALAIYEDKKLSTGELCGGMYDLGFDYPETYVIKQNGNIYYAFYATKDPVQSVELRGLEDGKTYKVTDYYNHVDLGTVTAQGETATLEAPVEKYLLIEVEQL